MPPRSTVNDQNRQDQPRATAKNQPALTRGCGVAELVRANCPGYSWRPGSETRGDIQIALLRALGGDMQATNFGVFWNNDFQLGDSWVLQAGVRYTDEEKTAQIITGACADVVTYVCTFDSLAGDWSNVTPKLGIQWNYNDDSQLYAFYSKGFRSGGFNFRNAKPLIIPPGPTKEEENNTFEIEQINGKQIADRLRYVWNDYPAALAKLKTCMDNVGQIYSDRVKRMKSYIH